MKSWYEIYKERQNAKYRKHIRTKYSPFLAQILASSPTQFVELGCGAGNITQAIREIMPPDIRHQHVLIDSCPKMLSLALENNPFGNCLFLCANLLQLDFHLRDPFDFDRVAHSHGVLEHFSDHDIIEICRQADKMAGRQYHYVPGMKYEKPSRGDERLLSVEQWECIMEKVEKSLRPGITTHITTFNKGYDYIIEIVRRRKRRNPFPLF